ncbi:MAG: FMN-binding protein, partial [Candidatus Thioglobus sp.]
ADKQRKKPKRLRNAGDGGREQLHVAKKTNRKLKKKDRTRLSQKAQEDQAQHGFQKPTEKVVREIAVPENIKVGDLAQKMATKVGEVLKVLMAIAHKETPGLGDKVELKKSSWIKQFKGLSLSNLSKKQWQVKPDGGDFAAFTGATITPRAIVAATYQVLELFKHDFLQGK